MTEAEKRIIRYAYDNVRRREESFADHFCEHNPDQAERRARDKDIFICGCDALLYEIERMIEQNERED